MNQWVVVTYAMGEYKAWGPFDREQLAKEYMWGIPDSMFEAIFILALRSVNG